MVVIETPVLAAAVSAARQGQSFSLLFPAMSNPSAFLTYQADALFLITARPRHFSHRLKNLACELGVPVIAISNILGPLTRYLFPLPCGARCPFSDAAPRPITLRGRFAERRSVSRIP